MKADIALKALHILTTIYVYMYIYIQLFAKKLSP